MKPKVYVAASSRELDRAQSVIDRLVNAGIEVTSDWTRSVERAREAGLTDATLSDRAAVDQADTCIRGVEAADVVLFLVPPADRPSTGAGWECGYARGIGKLVVPVGPHAKASIFARRQQLSADTDDIAVRWVIESLTLAGVAGFLRCS